MTSLTSIISVPNRMAVPILPARVVSMNDAVHLSTKMPMEKPVQRNAVDHHHAAGFRTLPPVNSLSSSFTKLLVRVQALALADRRHYPGIVGNSIPYGAPRRARGHAHPLVHHRSLGDPDVQIGSPSTRDLPPIFLSFHRLEPLEPPHLLCVS